MSGNVYAVEFDTTHINTQHKPTANNYLKQRKSLNCERGLESEESLEEKGWTLDTGQAKAQGRTSFYI